MNPNQPAEIKKRLRALLPTYAAIAVGLIVSLAVGSVRWNTANFWGTGFLAIVIVTAFDWLVLSVLRHDHLIPSQFLFRMMAIVVSMQTSFAFIYYFAATGTTYLAHSATGMPITEFVDALYFSGVTLLTVGYGDIVPKGDFRFTAVAEVYGGTLFIFAFFTWGLGIIATRRPNKI